MSKKADKASKGTTYDKFDLTDLQNIIMVLAGQKIWELNIPITFGKGKDAYTMTWALASDYFIRTQTDLPLIYANFSPSVKSNRKFVVRFTADGKPDLRNNPRIQHYEDQFLHFSSNASVDFSDPFKMARGIEELYCYCDENAFLLFTKLLYSEFMKFQSIELFENLNRPLTSIGNESRKEFSDLFKWTSTMNFSYGLQFQIRDFATQFQQLDETFEFEVYATSITVKSTLPANICKFNQFVTSDMTVTATLQPSIFQYWQIFNIDPDVRNEILHMGERNL